jgi:Cu/Ag efflux pump CusA
MSLARIVELAVRRRGVVLAIWGAGFLFALTSIRDLSIDAVPDVTNTQV